MAYVIYKSDNSLFVTLEDGQLDQGTTSLTLLGKNVVNYGQYENTNLVHLLENFAGTSEPRSPQPGQLWFDKTTTKLKLNVYNGAGWSMLPVISVSTSTPVLREGDFWWNPEASILYVQSTSTAVAIGGSNYSSSSADRLTTPRNINGVPFSGTASIVVKASTTFPLTFGNFISGSSFDGSTATTISVDIGVVNEATPNKVVARDNLGNIWFNIGYGTANASYYADLAEKYLSDKEYDVGTVMVIGGSKEITACSFGQRAIGVISEKPGLMMNEGLTDGVYVALKGRVPVKVTGKIVKGQRLVAGDNGYAIGVDVPNSDVFAIALEDNNNKNIIEALIL